MIFMLLATNLILTNPTIVTNLSHHHPLAFPSPPHPLLQVASVPRLGVVGGYNVAYNISRRVLRYYFIGMKK
jgi:hypothetical protein